MNTLSDTARAVMAAVLLAVAIGFGALGALSSSSNDSDEAARPYVYYRCYVQGYGWMYCTDSAHA